MPFEPDLLAGQHVLVLGCGDSGLAMARWAQRLGAAAITVADSRAEPPQAARLAADVPAARRVQGFDPALLAGCERVLKSPGLAPTDPALAPLLAAAAERGVKVEGELGLFAAALATLEARLRYAPRLIALTGTNGKTTTTMLCGLLAERAGRRVAVAGNVGPTLLDTLAAALDAEQPGWDAPAGGLFAPDWVAPVEAADAVEAQAAEAPATSTDPAADVADPVDADPAQTPVTPEGDKAAQAEVAEAGSIALPSAEAEAEAETEAETASEPAAAAALPPAAPRPAVFGALPEVWVLELSSFQLDGVAHGPGGFRPTAAAVLNLSQDHLDWHGTMAAYAQAKGRIHGCWASVQGRETVMIVNRDDAAVEALVPEPRVHKPAARGQRSRVEARRVQRFGLDAPQAPGDWGLLREGGIAWLVRALPADDTPRRGRDLEAEPLLLQRLMPADALRIRGRHNHANVLAALALCSAAGLPLAPMLHGLREYRGEPHRVEPLGILDGIEIVDDSKGTNVGATVAALRGLGEDKAPGRLAIVLGGDGKGQDFAPLAAPLAAHARAIALIGRDAEAIEAAILAHPGAAALPRARFATLEDATEWAFAQCRSGDALLLSPACASLDMFRNYAHRAEVFARTAQALALARGATLA
ncbi:UDP-N-acetylmuramoyl-L-alanine--D-glutamate ligase [Piscinibacter sp. Jin2]|uniref:UDP-N-acetylmuramoylalanine--D-glutamate ligase n=1 Tax=Aquariibacter lacus TaxID=2801332 RepID=A0A9X0XFM5_9BURK|nr:UDP-N-acetylmuramoyl-L-alanine--D-glutamate ligase [Piscinibacter lacus]MBL0720834.1 UDP-N-acetylmuramoyl-L-alanine--D-glutamate ligase [Piscinibacter lacus]